MAEDGKIIYKVEVDDSQAVPDAEKAGQKMGEAVEKGSSGASGFEQVMTGAARRIGEAFVNMGAKAVSAIGDIGQAGINFNAQMETYETAFTTLLGSGEEAQRVMAQIREDAAATPFDVDSLTQANQALVSAGVDADKAREDVLNLANAIAATGGGSAELSRMASNMQQIQNTGKASAMDIRQFANAGINIYGLLADSMGVTAAEAAEMEVSYDDLTKAFAQAAQSGGKYEGALERQSKTFTGRISTMKDNATQLAGVLTEDVFTQLSDTALPMVGDILAQLLEAAQTGGVEGALTAAGDILQNLIQTLVDNSPQLFDIGLTLIENLITGLGAALEFLIPAATQIVMALLTEIVGHAGDLLTAGLQLVLSLITGIVDAIPELIAQVPGLILAFVAGILDNLDEIITAGLNIILKLVEGLIGAIPELIMAIPQIIQAIFDAFAGADWLSIGTNIVQGIWDGITGLWDSMVSSVGGLVDGFLGTVGGLLGIASPSKKFRYFGEMSVEGMEQGLESGEGELTQTVTRVFSGLPDIASEEMFGRGGFEGSVTHNMQMAGRVPDTTIEVPLYLDGREVARATAYQMGVQMAWEEM